MTVHPARSARPHSGFTTNAEAENPSADRSSRKTGRAIVNVIVSPSVSLPFRWVGRATPRPGRVGFAVGLLVAVAGGDGGLDPSDDPCGPADAASPRVGRAGGGQGTAAGPSSGSLRPGAGFGRAI